MRPALWKTTCFLLLVLTSCRLIQSDQPTPAVEQTEAATATSQTPQDPDSVMLRTEKEEAPGEATSQEGLPLPTIEPMPTPDPSSDSWTILLYVSADNDLASSSLQALNDMERVGPPQGANVVVQLDSPRGASGTGETAAGAHRYELQADDDPQRVASRLVANLGPTNMGDPQTLAEFVAWGIDSYPANRFALVIRGQGGGWRGLAYDGGEEDDLSLPDLQGGLQRALAQVDRPRLDLVGLDAPLMGQLEVLAVLQPYADYAVASPGLQGPTAWNYGELLEELISSPDMDAPSLAQTMVAQATGGGSDDQDGALPDPNAGMAAVDLRRLPQVVASLASLVEASEGRMHLLASTVARARRVARSYGDMVPWESDVYWALDVGRFFTLLAEESPLHDVSRPANSLGESLARALLTSQTRAEEMPAGTLSLYFPPDRQTYDEAYEAVGDAAWPTFLQRYYESGPLLSVTPHLSLASLTGDTVGAQQPAHLSLELGGVDVARVSVVAVGQDSDRGRRLFTYDPLPADSGLGAGHSATEVWTDGLHRWSHVWDTTAAYVGDGANGDFVLLQPVGSGEELYAVEGRYLPAGGSDPQEATLLFDAGSRELDAVWGFRGGLGAISPRPLRPQAGDEFQLYQAFMDETWQVSYEPGATLVFTDGGDMAFDTFPLPSGEYQIGFLAETALGQRAAALEEMVVANDNLTPGFQAYLDPDFRFQFLYPLLWSDPAYEGGQLVARGPQVEKKLTVSLQPDMATGTASELQEQALQAFGPVHVLYEESIVVAGENGLLTAYGYESEAGPRTGILVTFVDGQRSMGFIVDVDGPSSAEGETLDLAQSLVDSWQFRNVASEEAEAGWRRWSAGDLKVALPADYRHQTLENGWELFKRDDHFLALRLDPLQRGGRPQIVAHWLDVAARGVEAFTADEPTAVTLAGSLWSRTDFTYAGDQGAVQGFIMAAILSGREIVAWAEAPAAVYEERVGNPFTIMVADAVASMEGRSGLLYEASFEESAGWGVGEMNGATAEAGGEAYEMAVRAARGFFWATAGQSFGDAVFELEATQTGGPLDNGYGMILRADNDADRFYVFALSGDGYIWIGRCDDGCAQAITLHGQGWLRSAAVRQGHDANNRLRVEALGPEMGFFVNGSEVARVKDDALTEGDVGFFVETLGEGGVRVRFDELRVVVW